MHDIYVIQHLIWLNTHWYMLLYVVLTSFLFAIYLRANEYHMWWFACIPVIGKFIQWKVAGVPLVLLILTRILAASFLLFDVPIQLLGILLILTIIENWIFARNYTTANGAGYALFPPYRYFHLIREVMP